MAYFRVSTGGGGEPSTLTVVAHGCSIASSNTEIATLAYTNSNYVSVSGDVMTAIKDFTMIGTVTVLRGTGAVTGENTTDCGTSAIRVMKVGASSYTSVIRASTSTGNRTTGFGLVKISTGDKIKLVRAGLASTWISSDMKIAAIE